MIARRTITRHESRLICSKCGEQGPAGVNDYDAGMVADAAGWRDGICLDCWAKAMREAGETEAEIEALLREYQEAGGDDPRLQD